MSSHVKGKKAFVAMSGGVDSSVALALLKEEGYDCIGVSMQLWDYSKKDGERGEREGGCCSLDDLHDARRVADKLGVPFYVVNMEELFSREVVDYFVAGYNGGNTPNPCIKCNEMLKFDALLKKAVGLEADFLATGHYARIIKDDGGFKLLKGVDPAKDQSYFLFTMTQGQLERALFPIGSLTKKDVRALARKAGLKTSEKRESQEICFVEGPRYADFLLSRCKAEKGEIVSTGGKALGTHNGLFGYTVGQRKGLSLSGGPYYVLAVDAAANRIVVGKEVELYSNALHAGAMNWINADAGKRAMNGTLDNVIAKVRYRHEGALCSVESNNEAGAAITFKTPQRAITPGQAVVLYADDEVLGGGWITRTATT